MKRARNRPDEDERAGVSRRSLLVGGGVGVGLLLAWGVWPRSYQPSLNSAQGEHVFSAFLKIGEDGQVIVVVPQSEQGQGVFTTLPQILADELGADWRTVAVQPAPIGPLYANSLWASEWLAPDVPDMAREAANWVAREYAVRKGVMLTGGSTSLRMFQAPFRDAGAAARVLLCKAAAARWGVPWESCEISEGLVRSGERTLRFGELAAEAAGMEVPGLLPYRQDDSGRLLGQSVPRLDMPGKIDGSVNFAGDMRLPDMVFASIRQGPVGDARLKSFREAEARKVTGFLHIVRRDHWVAVAGTNWWAANKALDALDPVFTLPKPLFDSDAMDEALEAAFTSDAGRRFVHRGDLTPVFEGATLMVAEYQVSPGLHLAPEPMVATARVRDNEVEVWMPTQAPGLARAAVARALDVAADKVTIYPMMIGGAYGRALEADAAVQAAEIARELGRPVQLSWSRAEDIIQDRPSAPANARMAAKLGRGGVVEGWLAKIAAPSSMAESWARMSGGERPAEALEKAAVADRRAIANAIPPYAIGNLAIDHYPAAIGLPTGYGRGGADRYGCFFNESFLDELAHHAGIEPLSFRIQMLGNVPRLAHCLSTAAAMAGWQGGIPGSGQGLSCHAMAGSYIALVVEADIRDNRLIVSRMVAAVDCGDLVHPDIVRQQIEGGLIHGLSIAMGASVPYQRGMPNKPRLRDMNLPRLADVREVTIELIRNVQAPGGVSDLAVPPVAPAIANALYTVTGDRIRSLPLLSRE